MKKRILLFGYSRANFGDDLFVYILAKRFPNVDFYIHINDEKYKEPFKQLANVICLETERNVSVVEIENFDAFIYVGGSIFIESDYAIMEMKEFTKFALKCKEKNKPLFYITCNFGPYKSKEYVDMAKNLFNLCENVCFRDRKSYNLFSDIKTVSYAPDIAFSYDLASLASKQKRSAGISIVDLSIRKDLAQMQDIYNDYIKRIVIMFAKRFYSVKLISFCEFEQDLKAIDRILDLVPAIYKKRVEVLCYKGNIKDFIKEYSKMRYMVCTRLHSMIVSTILKQKIYNISYSNKINNIVDDLNLPYKTDEISKLQYENILSKNDFKKIDDTKLVEIEKNAQKQFEALEKWLNK